MIVLVIEDEGVSEAMVVSMVAWMGVATMVEKAKESTDVGTVVVAAVKDVENVWSIESVVGASVVASIIVAIVVIVASATLVIIFFIIICLF